MIEHHSLWSRGRQVKRIICWEGGGFDPEENEQWVTGTENGHMAAIPAIHMYKAGALVGVYIVGPGDMVTFDDEPGGGP